MKDKKRNVLGWIKGKVAKMVFPIYLWAVSYKTLNDYTPEFEKNSNDVVDALRYSMFCKMEWFSELKSQNKISKDVDVQKMIVEECDKIKNLLLEKNKAYGNSAIEPLRVFSKLDNIEQIKVRIDDKLSRISKGSKTSIQEDTEQDLIGYLVLLRICKEIGGNK